MPIQRFLIKNFMQYSPEEGILCIAPHIMTLRFQTKIDRLVRCKSSHGKENAEAVQR
jgi:hypothetical protein